MRYNISPYLTDNVSTDGDSFRDTVTSISINSTDNFITIGVTAK